MASTKTIMRCKDPTEWLRSNSVGADFVYRLTLPPITASHVRSAVGSYVRLDEIAAAASFEKVAECVALAINRRGTLPAPKVRFVTEIKRASAKIRWNVEAKTATITLTAADGHGNRKSSLIILDDFAHEVTHFVDVFAFQLSRAYHTPGFYARSSALCDRLAALSM